MPFTALGQYSYRDGGQRGRMSGKITSNIKYYRCYFTKASQHVFPLLFHLSFSSVLKNECLLLFELIEDMFCFFCYSFQQVDQNIFCVFLWTNECTYSYHGQNVIMAKNNQGPVQQMQHVWTRQSWPVQQVHIYLIHNYNNNAISS